MASDPRHGRVERAPRTTEAPGRSTVDTLRWIWDVFGSSIKAAVAAALPSGAALAIVGRDFVTSPHLVPGWVIALILALAGLGALGAWTGWTGWRKRRRGGPLVIEHRGPRALNWTMGKRGSQDVMMVLGDFSITNRASFTAITPRSVLVLSYKRWGFLPARRHIDGFGVEPIEALSVRKDRLEWHLEPPILNRGDLLVARVCLIDQLGTENWTNWLRWTYAG